MAHAQPTDDLLRSIKAGFISQGTTFTKYCLDNGIQPPNARMAIRGGWKGPKATKLVQQIMKAAGVQEAA